MTSGQASRNKMHETPEQRSPSIDLLCSGIVTQLVHGKGMAGYPGAGRRISSSFPRSPACREILVFRGIINKLFYAEIPHRFGDDMLIILIILLLLFAFGGYRMGPGLGYYGGGGISLILLIIIILLLLRVI
jgi:hypothetical protein